MKARLGDIEVEGTVEEVASLIRSLQGSAIGGGDTREGAVAPIPASSRKYVAEDIAFKVLKRRSLSREQIAMLKALKTNHPGWTTATELQRVTRYKPAQLAGLLGAFGKRVTATEGYRKGTWFFDQEWDYEQDCNRYRFPDAVLTAVSRAGL